MEGNITATQGYLKTTLVERFIFVSIVALFVIGMSPLIVLTAYVTLSISHFLMTHIDQWRRDYYNRKNVALYVVISLISVLCLWANKECSIVFISTFFLLHSFFDDLRLMNLPVTRAAVLAAAPHILFIIFNTFDALINTHWAQHTVLAALAAYFAVVLYSIFKGLWRSSYIFYVLLITPVIFLIYFYDPQNASVKMFGFILIMHYFNWYTYTYHKYKALSPAKLAPYIWEAICMNGFFLSSVLLCFVIAEYNGWTDLKKNPLYWVVFQPYIFQFCGLTHIVVTMRKDDYSKFLRLLHG